MVQGFSQVESFDYGETFFSYSQHYLSLHFHSLSCHLWLSYTSNECSKNFFMQQPLGYVIASQETKVCRLLKTLYGLKQSPCMWYKQLNIHLLQIGYTECHGDPNVYIWSQKDGTFILLGLNVDEFIFISSNLQY